MAKRRNQKKEKALRNQAYARKFRKRTGTGRMGGRRRFGYGGGSSQEGDAEQAGRDRGGAEEAADNF